MNTVRSRRWLAVATLGLYMVSEAWAISMHEGWWSVLFAVFAVACGVAMVGVAKKIVWARWLAIGIGVTGLIDVWAIGSFFSFNEGLMLFATMPAAVLVCLYGRDMAEHFDTPRTWRTDNIPLRAIKLAAILAVPAVAGLLRYAAIDAPWIDGTEKIVALCCATLFAAGAIATVARKTVGAFLMLAPAFAVMGLAVDFGVEPGCLGDYFWPAAMGNAAIAGFVPAALATFVGFTLLIPAMCRFVKRA